MIGGVFHAQTAAACRPRFPRSSSSRRRAGRTRSRKYSLFVAERNSDYAICTTQATKNACCSPAAERIRACSNGVFRCFVVHDEQKGVFSMHGRKISKDEPHIHACIVCRYCRHFITCLEYEDLVLCSIPLDVGYCSECPQQHGERCAGFEPIDC